MQLNHCDLHEFAKQEISRISAERELLHKDDIVSLAHEAGLLGELRICRKLLKLNLANQREAKCNTKNTRP